MQFLPDTPSLRAWGLLSCATVASVVAGAALGFTLPLRDVVVTVVLFGGLLAIAGLGRVRFKSDAMSETCALFAFWIAMLAVLLPASYVAAGFNAPLIDETLQALDRAAGFDWIALQRWTDTTVGAAALFVFVYQYSIIQIPIAIIALASRRDLSRLNIFMTGLLIATVLTITTSALLPAAGAYRTYGITPGPSGNLAALVDVRHFLPDFDAVRSGVLRHLAGPLDGIIQFPSFHTVVAVSAGWATWRTTVLGPLNALLSGLVLLTTLPIGSHHLMDVIGGAMACFVGIVLATKIERPVPGQVPVSPERTPGHPIAAGSLAQ